jgi:DnaB-like helicase N terminal domain
LVTINLNLKWRFPLLSFFILYITTKEGFISAKLCQNHFYTYFFLGCTGIEKAIPHNPEAEEAVIGSLLIDRDIILKVAGILEPSDFFSFERGSIYQAILDLYANRAPADLITLRNELRERGLLGEEEGQVRSSYLINLMRSTPTPVHVQHYGWGVYFAPSVRTV